MKGFFVNSYDNYDEGKQHHLIGLECPKVRKVMADHLGLPVLDQSLKEAFSPRFVNCQPTQIVLLST